jgi:hypothetical protein
MEKKLFCFQPLKTITLSYLSKQKKLLLTHQRSLIYNQNKTRDDSPC